MANDQLSLAYKNHCNILELPEYVLGILLTYLDATSLFLLKQTCQYLKEIIDNPRFWKYINALREPNTNDKVNFCAGKINEKTTHVFFRAKLKYCGQVPNDFFTKIRPFGNLKVLALENQRFNGSNLLLKDFPLSLEELSLKKTYVKNSEYFFQHSGASMRKLRVLILDECQWVTCSFLMSIAKFENLEIISAVKCQKLHSNMFPYLNIARYGCKKLKVFDCRFTGIGHELLRSFNRIESIQNFYFQSLKSSEYDYNENIFNSFCMRVSQVLNTETNCFEGNICDHSLLEYLNAISFDFQSEMPTSVLYKDPYPECNCGYKGEERQSDCPSDVPNEEYVVFEPKRGQIAKFVCSKHAKDVESLPDEYKDFFVTNQEQFHNDVCSDEDSDSSNDEERDGACCMYGMGTKMVFLTPGNPQESILHLDNVLVANPHSSNASNGESSTPSSDKANLSNSTSNASQASTSNASPEPSPSSSTARSDNSINENIENSRTEARKRQAERDDESERPNKRLKISNNELNGQEVDELVQNADDVGNRLNEAIHHNIEVLYNRQNVIIRRRQSNEAQGPSLRRDNVLPERNPLLVEQRPRGNFFVELDLVLKKKLKLKRLSLRGFRRVTDFGLDYLKNLNIELLDLTYTNVTKTGIDNFLNLNPNCRVIHPLHCRCKPLKPF